MDRIKPPEQETDLALPKPWEDRPISEARWRRHRDTMLQWAYPGSRPREWWQYERGMPRPDQEAWVSKAPGAVEVNRCSMVVSPIAPIWFIADGYAWAPLSDSD